MRILDVVMSFPGIALAVVFVAVFGQSLPVLIFTIAFLYVPQLTRIVRANILDQYGEDYVSAVRVMGTSTPRIIAKHVARNTMAPVLVFATVLVADAIVFEASLSFLQAGVPDPEPSWGNVIAAGRNLLMSGAWWATFFPGLLIMITVLCLNILSEGMTDAMVAPKARKLTADAASTKEATSDLEERAGADRARTSRPPRSRTAARTTWPSPIAPRCRSSRPRPRSSRPPRRRSRSTSDSPSCAGSSSSAPTGWSTPATRPRCSRWRTCRSDSRGTATSTSSTT